MKTWSMISCGAIGWRKTSVFELKSHPPISKLASFQQGFFYIQDPSTLLAVRELNPQPGETILDLCAAPGGKLTYIAQLMRNTGRLVAHDTSPERLKLIEENCARLGIAMAKSVLPSTLDPRPSDLRPRSSGCAVLEHRRDASTRGFALADSAGGNRASPRHATRFASPGSGALEAGRHARLQHLQP